MSQRLSHLSPAWPEEFRQDAFLHGPISKLPAPMWALDESLTTAGRCRKGIAPPISSEEVEFQHS